MAAMLAGAMMLDFLGEAAAATAMEGAVLRVLADPNRVTPDLGGPGTTSSVTDAVVGEVE
jgi:tartrate dehydrogenase/decarboxylase/D-malate dehydrogenase